MSRPVPLTESDCKPPLMAAITQWWRGGNMTALYIGFFITALIIRVTYVFSLRDSPLFESLILDPAYHHQVALEILNEGLLAGAQPFHRSPLYMYVLALIYKIFGVGYLVPRLFGALTGSISVLLVMRLTHKLFDDRRAAIIAGCIALFSWTMIFFDGELLTTSFTIMMGLILLLLFIRAYEKQTAKNMIIFGLFFGLMTITRENYFPIIGLAFLFLLFIRREVLLPALFFISALVMIAPVTLRNYVVLDDFIPINFNTTINFYIGNNPTADGRTAVVPCTRGDFWGGVEDHAAIVQQHYDRPVKPSDITRFWGGKTLGYIWNNFATCDPKYAANMFTAADGGICRAAEGTCHSFLRNVVKKFFFIFDLREYSNNKALYFFRDQSAVLSIPWFWLFSPFLYIPLGVLGIFLALSARNKAVLPLYVILVGYTIGLCLGFVNTRFRMPIMVILMMFSGYAACRVCDEWREKRLLAGRLAVFVGVAVLSLVINTPMPGHYERSERIGHFTLGNAFLRVGELDIAESHYMESIKITDGKYPNLTRNGLAKIEMQRGSNIVESDGDLAIAESHFRRSLEYRRSYEGYLNLGYTLAKTGKDALFYYLAAVRMRPNDLRGHARLAQYYNGAGDKVKAREHLQTAKSLHAQILAGSEEAGAEELRVEEFLAKLEADINSDSATQP